jgi:hypothetical protein
MAFLSPSRRIRGTLKMEDRRIEVATWPVVVPLARDSLRGDHEERNIDI